MKSDIPCISVITPTYNIVKNGRKDRFVQGLRSVHSQTYKHIEHIVIDGASTDGTKKILEEYKMKGWIEYCSESDSGIYEAMNKGIRRTKGDYIVFLNSDDIFIDNDFFSSAVNRLECSDCDYVYARTRYIDKKGVEHPELQQTNPNMSNLLFFMPFCHQTMICRKRVFTDLMFNESHKSISDYEWLLGATLINGIQGSFIDSLSVEFLLGGMCNCVTEMPIVIRENIEAYYNIYHKINSSVTYSDCEMIEYLKVIPDKIQRSISGCLDGRYRLTLSELNEEACSKELLSIYKVNEKNNYLLELMSEYLSFSQSGRRISNLLRKRKFNTCIIYGYGFIGKGLLNELMQDGFDVEYVVDKDAKCKSCPISIKTLDEAFSGMELLVVITATYYKAEIKESLAAKGFNKIIGIDELLEDESI